MGNLSAAQIKDPNDAGIKKWLIIAICLLLLSGCTTPEKTPELIDSLLLPYFREMYPEEEIVLMIEGDCNDDGITDLVVVFRQDADHNRLVTVFSYQGGFRLTEPIPAPFQDVRLEWITLELKEIDGTYPTALLVSGRRGTVFGLRVLRFMDNEWIDLFGGLEGCGCC